MQMVTVVDAGMQPRHVLNHYRSVHVHFPLFPSDRDHLPILFVVAKQNVSDMYVDFALTGKRVSIYLTVELTISGMMIMHI